MSPSRARRCASAASRTAWPGRLISSDALMNAHPDFVVVWSAFSITSKSARIAGSPVSSARRLAFVSRPSRARRLRPLSASATSRSLEPKCWYRVRFVTPACPAIASTPVPVMPRAYVSSLVAARSASCAFGRSGMNRSIRTARYTAARCLPTTGRRYGQHGHGPEHRATGVSRPILASIPTGMYTAPMNRRVSHVIAGWRTGLPRSVLILQAGNALNYFGFGLVLPFEIIYLHQIRGFSTSTAGLVLATVMGTAAIVTPPTGALLDRYSAKAIVVAGSLASTLGYAGFAFVDSPWQAFGCSIVSGAGIGAANTANRTLTIRLIKREQRTAAFALNRVAGNFGIGSGATVAGFIVAFAQQLSSFQTLYIFDAVTYAAFALIVLAAVP